MRTRTNTILSALVVCAGLAACAEPQRKRSASSLTFGNEDLTLLADQMANSFHESVVLSGKLSSPPGRPAVLAFSRIANATSQHFDTDLIVLRIRIAIEKTGRIVVVGDSRSQADDSKAKTNVRPDLTLSGKIIELQERNGRTHQISLVFHLSLTAKDGILVWEEEKTVAKQSRRRLDSYGK